MIYTIKKGNNNDSKFRIPDFWIGNFSKTWKVALSPECWYDWTPDDDQKDINKLTGVTRFMSANNKDSAMVGWNPCLLPKEEVNKHFPHTIAPDHIKDVKYFNLYLYINDEKGGHTKMFITVIADWRVNDYNYYIRRTKEFYMEFLGEAIQHLYKSKEELNKGEKNFKMYPPWTLGLPKLKGVLREIFIWFGGENNAPGPHGGIAPHDMQVKGY